MKKITLLKTLLVAVMLLGGANFVWAGTASWTVSNKSYTSGEELSSNTAIVSVTLGNGTWTYNSSRSGVYVASQEITKTDGIPTGGGYIVIEPVIDINFSLSTYSTQNNVNLVMIEASSPETEIKDFRQKAYNTNDFGKLEAGKTYYIFGHNFKDKGTLDYIFYKDFTAKSYEDCTINYKYESETIKSEVVNNYIGSTVTASMTSLWNDGGTTKYYVADDATTSFTVAESGNTFEVKLRLAATDAIATVNAIDGNSTILKSFTATGIEGETKDYIYYTRAVLYNGQYYVVPAANGNSRNYAKANVVYGGDPVTVTYTLDETITYYAEEKDLTLSRAYAANGDAPERASGGNWSRFYKGAYARTAALEAGVYTLEVSGRNQGNEETLDIKVYSGSALGDVIASPSWSKAGNVVNTVNNILVPEGGSIAICNPNASYNSNIGLDYVIVRKVYDIEGEVVGKVDYSTSYSTVWNTTPIWINAGETAYYKFKNYNNTSSANLYENWYLFAANESSTNLAIFGPNHTNTADGGNGSYTSQPTFTMSDLNGATVELTATLADAGDDTYTLTVTGVTTKADGSTTLSPNLVYTQKGLTVSKLKLYISPEKNWLELLQEAVKKNITSAGYATYYSNNALDFANATPSLTASLITGTVGATTTLALDDVDDVPAETGVLLAGDEATYTIPVIATSSTVTTSNKLEGVHVATEIDAETGYVLMGSPKVGFYMNNYAFTVGANTAYLPADFAGARMAFFGFDDEATGVQNLTPALSEGEGVVYNLRGQRVAQPTKGLYIVNGKKVVIK